MKKQDRKIVIGRLNLYNAGLAEQQAQDEYIMAQLADFDAENGLNKGNEYLYIYSGDILFPLQRIFYNIKPTVKFILGIFRNGKLPTFVRLPFLCRFISISTNLRIFEYNSDPKRVVKVALKNVFRIGNLCREVRARKLVTKKGQLEAIIPKIIDYDREEGKWLIEENIAEAGDASTESKAEEFLNCYALNFYKATSRLVSLNKVIGNSGNLFIDDPLKKMITEHKDFRDGLLLPFAFCHGDLSPLNMIKDKKGRFYVVDWEFATHNPVAYDLAKIYRSYPALRKKTLDLLVFVSGDSNQILKPELQMAIALGKRYTDARIKIDKQIGAIKLDQEKVMAEFEALLQEKLIQHKLLINELIRNS